MVRNTEYGIRNTASKGFSLYELMVTVAILSVGLMGIYEAFFTSADAASNMSYYLRSQVLMDEMIWKDEDLLRQNGYLFPEETSGGVFAGSKMMTWNKAVRVLDHLRGLYSVDLKFSWRSGSKTIKNSRITYVRR